MIKKQFSWVLFATCMMMWVGDLKAINVPAFGFEDMDALPFYGGHATFLPEEAQDLDLGFLRDVLDAPVQKFVAAGRIFGVTAVWTGAYENDFQNAPYQTALKFTWEMDAWHYYLGHIPLFPNAAPLGHVHILLYEQAGPHHMGPIHVGDVMYFGAHHNA